MIKSSCHFTIIPASVIYISIILQNYFFVCVCVWRGEGGRRWSLSSIYFVMRKLIMKNFFKVINFFTARFQYRAPKKARTHLKIIVHNKTQILQKRIILSVYSSEQWRKLIFKMFNIIRVSVAPLSDKR